MILVLQMYIYMYKLLLNVWQYCFDPYLLILKGSLMCYRKTPDMGPNFYCPFKNNLSEISKIWTIKIKNILGITECPNKVTLSRMKGSVLVTDSRRWQSMTSPFGNVGSERVKETRLLRCAVGLNIQPPAVLDLHCNKQPIWLHHPKCTHTLFIMAPTTTMNYMHIYNTDLYRCIKHWPIYLNQGSIWSSFLTVSASFLPTLMIPSRSFLETGLCRPMWLSSYIVLSSLKKTMIALMMCSLSGARTT